MSEPSTFTYDLDTPIGLVRWRISDKFKDDPVFYDEEIQAALTMEGDNIKRASALCLETIAADEVRVQKVIKLLQLSTDGAKVATELRANAKLLRDQADIEAPIDQSGLIDIAQWNINDRTAEAILWNAALRIGG